MRVPTPTTTRLAVTALVRAWIKRMSATETPEAIAKRLGVTRTTVVHVRDGSRNVGDQLEANFAALAYNGSVDELRAVALREYEQHRAAEEQFPNRAEAADVCRRSGLISEEAIQSVLSDPPPATDVSTIEWIDRIRLRELELRRSAPSAAGGGTRTRKKP